MIYPYADCEAPFGTAESAVKIGAQPQGLVDKSTALISLALTVSHWQHWDITPQITSHFTALLPDCLLSKLTL